MGMVRRMESFDPIVHFLPPLSVPDKPFDTGYQIHSSATSKANDLFISTINNPVPTPQPSFHSHPNIPSPPPQTNGSVRSFPSDGTGNNRNFVTALMGPQSVDQMELPIPVIKGNLPSIKLASHVEERGLLYCKLAVVGRLDLNLLKIEKVREIAKNVWKPIGDCKTVPLGRGYLMFRFDSQTDFDRVISIPSWSFGSQTLRLQKWSPSFDPESMSNSHANVWVKFPKLKQQFWDKEALFSMANAIGKPISLDKITRERSFGYFASVMVEVDMSKHLPDKIVVELNSGVEFIQEVQYSGLPKFCSFCKMIGHVSSECRKFQALKDGILCSHCNLAGHTLEDCRRLKVKGGEAKNFKQSKRRGNRGKEVVQFDDNSTPTVEITLPESTSLPKTRGPLVVETMDVNIFLAASNFVGSPPTSASTIPASISSDVHEFRAFVDDTPTNGGTGKQTAPGDTSGTLAGTSTRPLSSASHLHPSAAPPCPNPDGPANAATSASPSGTSSPLETSPNAASAAPVTITTEAHADLAQPTLGEYSKVANDGHTDNREAGTDTDARPPTYGATATSPASIAPGNGGNKAAGYGGTSGTVGGNGASPVNGMTPISDGTDVNTEEVNIAEGGVIPKSVADKIRLDVTAHECPFDFNTGVGSFNQVSGDLFSLNERNHAGFHARGETFGEATCDNATTCLDELGGFTGGATFVDGLVNSTNVVAGGPLVGAACSAGEALLEASGVTNVRAGGVYAAGAAVSASEARLVATSDALHRTTSSIISEDKWLESTRDPGFRVSDVRFVYGVRQSTATDATLHQALQSSTVSSAAAGSSAGSGRSWKVNSKLFRDKKKKASSTRLDKELREISLSNRWEDLVEMDDSDDFFDYSDDQVEPIVETIKKPNTRLQARQQHL